MSYAWLRAMARRARLAAVLSILCLATRGQKVFNLFLVNFLLRNNFKGLNFQCWPKSRSLPLTELPDGVPV